MSIEWSRCSNHDTGVVADEMLHQFQFVPSDALSHVLMPSFMGAWKPKSVDEIPKCVG